MSHPKPSHTTLRRALILLLWIGLVAIGVAPGAYSDESPGSGVELPPKPSHSGANEGPIGLSQRALTRGPKLIIRLPDALGWLFQNSARDPNAGAPRPRAYPVPEEWQSDVVGCQVLGRPYFNDLFVISPNPGGTPTAGNLPPVTVRAVAFGSIPVTATLRLSQIVDGELEPFHADFWTRNASPACDPTYNEKVPITAHYVRGRLSLTLSEVKIDGEKVDIGSRCQTVEPLQINMWGERALEQVRPPDAPPDWEPGWSPTNGGKLFQREDLTRAPVPDGKRVNPGSTDLTIPDFTGCVSAAGEDISPLLTATISGPGNELAITQPGVNLNGHRSDPTTCYETGPAGGTWIECPLDPPAPPAIPVPTD